MILNWIISCLQKFRIWLQSHHSVVMHRENCSILCLPMAECKDVWLLAISVYMFCFVVIKTKLRRKILWFQWHVNDNENIWVWDEMLWCTVVWNITQSIHENNPTGLCAGYEVLALDNKMNGTWKTRIWRESLIFMYFLSDWNVTMMKSSTEMRDNWVVEKLH